VWQLLKRLVMAEDSQRRLYGTVASIYCDNIHLLASEVNEGRCHIARCQDLPMGHLGIGSQNLSDRSQTFAVAAAARIIQYSHS
jgi:hypothetical protein